MLADLRKKCSNYYETEIKPLCLIKVEGKQYEDGELMKVMFP